jgi:acyl-CoA reductase-like NAD-dependent aldehyde dehydrogenase
MSQHAVRLLDQAGEAAHRAAQRAVALARSAQPAWARTAPVERGQALRAAAVAVRAAAEELTELLHGETGKLPDEARGSVHAAADTLDQYGELGPLHTAASSRGRTLLGGWDATDMMVPGPRGVIAAMTPWNDPIPIACGLLGAAVVTGNTAVHKPSERCPRTGMVLTDLLAHHLPDGVLVGVPGGPQVGAALVAHPGVDLVAHVGGTATGRRIAEAAARTGAAVLRENGGNDALVVDGDVDPRWAAEEAAVGAFTNAGQICTSVERIFVHERVAEEFVAALVEQARHRVPDPASPDDIRMARLVDRAHLELVHSSVGDAVARGAKLHTGGALPEDGGTFYPATVLTGCTRRMRVLSEETFGPVAPVQVVPSFEHALAAAAEDEHGLAATVLTRCLEHAQRAWRELPVGTVKVNAVFGGAPGGAAQPRGVSGAGFGFGPELLDEMTTTKVVHLSLAPPLTARDGGPVRQTVTHP